MPIEDDMLDDIERRGVAAPGRGGASSTGQLDSIVQPDATGAPRNIGQVPFSGEPGLNPLGAIMTSLSVLLGPRIASDAAQAAIRALASDDPTAFAAAIEAARRGVDQHPVSTDAAALDGGADGEGAPAAPPTPPDPSRTLSDADLRAAAVVALAAAAERAKSMALEQEYEMERCVRQVLRAQVDRVGIKLKYLQKIDEMLDQETSKQEEMLEKTVVVAR
jgi:SWI/SNF related-matrix-associated actin-dependent regulator of chromatin subfamily C